LRRCIEQNAWDSFWHGLTYLPALVIKAGDVDMGAESVQMAHLCLDQAARSAEQGHGTLARTAVQAAHHCALDGGHAFCGRLMRQKLKLRMWSKR
jgi:hypothetical protein